MGSVIVRLQIGPSLAAEREERHNEDPKDGQEPDLGQGDGFPVLENRYDAPGQEDTQESEVERPKRRSGMSPRCKEEKVNDADGENSQSEQRKQPAALDHPHDGHDRKPNQAAKSAEKPSESWTGHRRNPFIDACHYKNSRSGRKATRDASRRLAMMILLSINLCSILGQHLQVSVVRVYAIPLLAGRLVKDTGLAEGVDGLPGGRLGGLEEFYRARQRDDGMLRQEVEEPDSRHRRRFVPGYSAAVLV